MICVIKYPADGIFRAARALFVFEQFPIGTWSVADYLNNNNVNQRIKVPEALCIHFLKYILHIKSFISV